jgi:DNA-binding transcriptional LysR family regulator
MTAGFSNRTPQQALAALLDRYAPKRLLLIGAQEFPALQAFQDAHPETELARAAPGALPADLAAQRFDLALVVDCLEHIPKRSGLELLGGIRNLNASRIAVLADLQASKWQETDFFSLALQASERFARDEQILTLFTYDLHEYKQVPDWLNARFWANPENFGKYWW